MVTLFFSVCEREREFLIQHPNPKLLANEVYNLEKEKEVL